MCKAYKIINYINGMSIGLFYIRWYFWGREMTEFIWYWRKGNSKVFTRDTDVAERAMRDGKLVMGMKAKPRIQRF